MVSALKRANIRFHVTVAGVRTTVTMDAALSRLLSLHLTGAVDQGVVRTWCQRQIDVDPGQFEGRVSQRLSRLVVLEMVPKALREAYWDVELAQAQEGRRARRGRTSKGR
jgi:hypothetical protein